MPTCQRHCPEQNTTSQNELVGAAPLGQILIETCHGFGVACTVACTVMYHAVWGHVPNAQSQGGLHHLLKVA